ncbi:MAG: hypothetical protein A3I68_03635 [Candidatus Melainabacteria bacterium RIFCSPLOWO2_02_FULL_35_15]|nr:MAG: hypothetical protein A3F80_03950 [Candidatus Melainabacteria bacterium RIFCSPLOWO2_12_FULL_35_11]OGI14692.1 MAG: hypothetical protein A3I68_03635 [Candidatus Melainabacteria bacterium RIFCSPLOWO2_02_FULL_35_15]
MKFNFSFWLLVLCLVYLVLFCSVKNYSKELINKKQVFQNQWQKLNGPFGGQGYTIRFDKNNSNKIIVTDSFAGIHISYDRGLTWIESVNGIDARTGRAGDSVPVFITTIDPNDSNRIWCGVKNAMGVFLSTDGGMSWQRKDNGLPEGTEVEIRGLAVKPGDSNTVFAAGDLEEIGPFMGSFQRTQGIVYRTTDGGENWMQVLSGGNLFKDIIIDPNNPDVVYVDSGIFDRQQLEKLEGVHKSTDSGNTWTQINNGIKNLYVTSLKFDPTNSNILWGTTGMLPQFETDFENYDGAIIVSRDAGMSWTEAKHGRLDGNKQIYSALGISPTNPKVIYAGAFGFFVRSTDGGMTWKELGFGPLGSNAGHPIDIAVDPANEDIVYVDSYIGGVFKSTDGGETWVTNAFGYSGAETRGLAVAPDGESVFVTSRSGVFLSKDKGINWLPVGLGDIELDELLSVSPHPTDKNKILLGNNQNGKSSIFLSTDGGMIWKTVFMIQGTDPHFPNALGLAGSVGFTDIEWSKSNPNIAFASCAKKSLLHDSIDSISWGVFKSTDGGMTWQNKQKGIPGFKNTWSLAIDPKNEDVVYVATNGSGILKTTDGGENWTQINNGLQDVTTFRSIVISPVNSQILLAGNENGQIFRSEDAGTNWQAGSIEFKPHDDVTSIIFNPVNPNQVFASCDATGFYVSNDGGINWEQFNDGLLVRDVQGLAITPDGSAVYASTNGGGIFRLALRGENLILTKRQIEIPSNAGVDAKNNIAVGITSTSSSSSSTGGVESGFSLSITGPGLDGIMLFENMLAKTFLSIGFDQNLFTNQLLPSKVQVSSNLPTNAIKIRPQSFLLTAQDSGKKVTIVVPSLNKLGKIKAINDLFGDSPPDSVTLTVTQTTQGMIFLKDIDIPVN